MDTDVAIIGGGIAGLACGLALGERGLRVTLLEAAEELGGRARSCTDSVTGERVDIGPHILLSEYRNMLQLLEQLGTRDQLVWNRGEFLTLADDPPLRICMHPLPAPLHFGPSMLAARQVSLKALGSNARLLYRVLGLDQAELQALDQRDAEAVLREYGVDESFIDWFWRSACMAIMNVPLERCSAGALFGFFRHMIGQSGYQVGFAGGPLADLYAPAARARIEAAGGRVLTGTRVAALTGDAAALTGLQLADGTELTARSCVAALPPQDLLPLLPAAWRRYPGLARLGDFAPSPYVSTYLWFDHKLTDRRLWTRLWSPETLSYDSYDLSNIRPDRSRRGSLIASNIIYSHRAERLSEAQIIERVRAELAEFLPEAARAPLRHARVHRIPMAIPAPYPGSEALRPEPGVPVQDLYLAGDWIRTGLPASMESAVRGGWLAAEQVLAALGRPARLALAPPQVDAAAQLAARLRH